MHETLTAAEIEEIARFDEHWRVTLADDNAMLVWSLAKRGPQAPRAAIPA